MEKEMITRVYVDSVKELRGKEFNKDGDENVELWLSLRKFYGSGNEFRSAANELVKVADVANHAVSMSFNGVVLTAKPGNKAYQIYMAYEEKLSEDKACEKSGVFISEFTIREQDKEEWGKILTGMISGHPYYYVVAVAARWMYYMELGMQTYDRLFEDISHELCIKACSEMTRELTWGPLARFASFKQVVEAYEPAAAKIIERVWWYKEEFKKFRTAELRRKKGKSKK